MHFPKYNEIENIFIGHLDLCFYLLTIYFLYIFFRMFGRSQNNWEKKKTVPNNRCKDTHMYVCVYVCMYLYVCNTHISVFLFVLFGHAAYGILVP